MALDTLPGEIIVKTRDQVKADYLRSYKIRNPTADTGPETQPDIDASTFADQMVPVYANAQTAGNNILLKNTTGSRLDQVGESEGVPRNPATKSSGWVICTAAATGGTIFELDELREPNTSLRFECALTAHYDDGDLVPVRSVDTGLAVNLDAGVVLAWTSPRPGIGPSGTIYEQADGTGLKGGAEAEGDDTYRVRIEERRANPPASGNAAEYIKRVESTPGMNVQKAFAYPAIFGAGTIALAFTVSPQTSGASRLPTSGQITDVESWVIGHEPEDDSAFFLTLLDDLVDVALGVEWTEGHTGWADIAPWPPRYETGVAPGAPGKVVVSAATDATHFSLRTDNDDYTGVIQPAVGQTIAFFDGSQNKFRAKRILTVTGTGPWVIVCDTAAAASDTLYTPAVGQPACPYSASLDAVATPVLGYFAGFGPGEQVASFFDAGYRQRRFPRPPREWPIEISNRVLDDVFELPEVQDADLLEGAGVETTVGTLGMSAYLMKLRYLTIFQLP